MSPTLIAVGQPLNDPPRVQLTISGFTSGAGDATAAIVYRVDSGGNRTPVRTGNPAALTGGGWPGYDYEAPLDEPVTYLAVATDQPYTASSGTIDLGIRQPWLMHPGIPSLSMPITVAARGDRTHATNQGVFTILERAEPVVRTDGKRRAPTFDLTVRTHSLEEEQRLAAILDDASPLLLQLLYDGIERTVYQWVAVGDVVESDKVPWLGTDVIEWVLPCTSVAAPAGLLQAQWTYADLAAAFASGTYADLTAAFATYRDLALNNRIGV